MLPVTDNLEQILQVLRSREIARYLPADLLEAFAYIVGEGTLLSQRGALPLQFKWHTKFCARTTFVVQNKRHGLESLEAAVNQSRKLVLVLRNFGPGAENLGAISEPEAAQLFFAQQNLRELHHIAAIRAQLPATSDILFVQDLLALSRHYTELFSSMFASGDPEGRTSCVLVPAAQWQRSVSTLIGLADCIFLFASEASPGLSWEAEELIRQAAQDRTMLLSERGRSSGNNGMRRPGIIDMRPAPAIPEQGSASLERALNEFPNRFDLHAPDLGEQIAAILEKSTARRGVKQPLPLHGILTDSLRDALPSSLSAPISAAVEDYRPRMEAASIGKDPYELFVSSNLVLGLAASVSQFATAAYASECLALGYAHYARRDVDRLAEAGKPNAAEIARRLSEISQAYWRWAGNEPAGHNRLQESIKNRHA